MGITRVPFGRTEILVPPLEPQERNLAQGKGPRGPELNHFRKKCKKVSFVNACFICFDMFGKTNKKNMELG